MTSRKRAAGEWPTWGLAAVIYGGWLALTLFWRDLPWPLLLLGGAWLIAWHMSLQHEVIHGHPTGVRAIDDALGFPPLSLWLPYGAYAESHRRHHRDPSLTVPGEDPESFYLAPETWAALGGGRRRLLRFANTFPGRLLIGPALGIVGFLRAEARAIREGRAGRRRQWAVHALAVAAIIGWLAAVGVPLWQYLLLAVYPGYALALVRSFAEHRAAAEPAERVAIVENAPLFGLLFLYNNLHAVHHRWPGLPWYEIPRVYRANRASVLAANGGLVYDGYADVARRFLRAPHHEPPFPHTLPQRG